MYVSDGYSYVLKMQEFTLKLRTVNYLTLGGLTSTTICLISQYSTERFSIYIAQTKSFHLMVKGQDFRNSLWC